MENIITAKFLTQTTEIIDAMYRLGWDERNGGNFSYLLEQEELARYLDQNKVLRTIPLGFDATP
ncbi:MAG: rhamnulose-1-phosphate aldolase, partial [Angelakisella sp.]